MSSETSWNYYFDNRDTLMKKYPGFFVLIKDGKLCAVYTDERAVEANKAKHGNEVLILQLLPSGPVEYTSV